MDQKILMFALCIWLLFQISIEIDHNISFTLTPTTVTFAEPYQYSLTKSNTTVCSIVLKKNTTLSQSVLLIAKTSSNSPQILRANYQRLTPKDFTDKDLQNANKGQDQIVQIRGLNSSSIIYIFLVIFDVSYQNYTYLIQITQKTQISNYCSSSLGSPNPNNIYCANCLTLHFGAYCRNQKRTLNEKVSYQITLNSGSFKSYNLKQRNLTLIIYFQAGSNSVQAFIQFKDSEDQIAGVINNFVNYGNKVRYLLVPNQKIGVAIINPSKDISIGILNNNINSVNVDMSYEIVRPLEESKLIIVIFAVAGGIFVLFILIGVIVYIRNKCVGENSILINPLEVQRMEQLVNQLSNDQIQMYFPSVSAQIAHIQHVQLSQLALNQNKTEKGLENDCVICLCPIQHQNTVKITYCNHIFHSQCLVEWFKKLKNCPYCRKQFTKNATIQEYQKVRQNSGKSLLSGEQLVQEILKYKQVKSRILKQIQA